MSYTGKIVMSIGILIVGIVAIPILYIHLFNWFFGIQIETTLMNVLRLYMIGFIMSIFGAGMRFMVKEIMGDER
jgi:hypothetical protein